MSRQDDGANHAEPDPRRWVWAWRTIAWALPLAILVGLATASLHRRVQHWEMILERKVQRVVSQEYSPRIGADFSPDARLLAIGRMGGVCELWDISSTPKLVRTIGQPLPPDEPGQPVYARLVRWLPSGKHLAICSNHGWDVFDLENQPVSIEKREREMFGDLRGSPSSNLVAVRDHSDLSILDLATGQTLNRWKLYRVNGGSARIDWTPDGKYLLMNDRLGVRVWDMTGTGQLVFYHRELDLSLPMPMIADDLSGYDGYYAARDAAPATQPASEQPSKTNSLFGIIPPAQDFATVVESRFSPDGSFVAAIYQPDNESFLAGYGNPKARLLRFYETATGKLLWETLLAANPLAMDFAHDSSHLYVLCDAKWPERSRVEMFDTRTRRQVESIALARLNTSMQKLAALPGGRMFVLGSTAWIVSASGSCAPVRVPTAYSELPPLTTRDGNTLMVGNDGDIQVYRRLRNESALGAFALPETWFIYLATGAIVIGTVITAGRDAARNQLRLLSRPLWSAAILGCLALSFNVAEGLVESAVADVYNDPYEKARWWQIGWHWIVSSLIFGTLISMMRLRRGWWITRIVMVSISTAVVGVALLFMIKALSSGKQINLPAQVWHGIQFQLSTMLIVLAILASFGLCIFELILLLLPSVRAEFPRKQRWYDHARRGFAVEDSREIPNANRHSG